MKPKQKNILIVGGVIAAILGIVLLIPSMLKGDFLVATISGLLIVGGLVLLAIGLGD